MMQLSSKKRKGNGFLTPCRAFFLSKERIPCSYLWCSFLRKDGLGDQTAHILLGKALPTGAMLALRASFTFAEVRALCFQECGTASAEAQQCSLASTCSEQEIWMEKENYLCENTVSYTSHCPLHMWKTRGVKSWTLIHSDLPDCMFLRVCLVPCG